MATYPGQRCGVCGDGFTAHSTAALYCGNACKQRAHQARRTDERRRLLALREAVRSLDNDALRRVESVSRQILSISAAPDRVGAVSKCDEAGSLRHCSNTPPTRASSPEAD